MVVASLFDDAFSVTILYTAYDMVIIEWWWMGKDSVGGSRGLIQGTIPSSAWKDWVKHENLNQDSR
jgi:hypothetical protein